MASCLDPRFARNAQDLGVTRVALADVSGVSHESLKSIELGRTCSLSTLHRLAVGLHTTAREMLVGVYPWDGGSWPR